MNGPVLAVDLGTSSLRVAIVDRDESIVQLVQHGYERNNRAVGGTFAAEPLADLLRRSLRELDTTGVRRVAVSALWHTVLGVDALDRPLTQTYTWESTSPSAGLKGLGRLIEEDDYRGRTGSYLHASYPLAAIWWIRQHADCSVRYTDLPSWLLRQVLGAGCGWSDQIAAGSGLWNQQLRTWDAGTCAAIGLDPEMLGQTWSDPVVLTGVEAAEYGLEGAELLPVLSDGVCDNLGLGVVGDGAAALTSGTSGSVRLLLDAVPTSVPHGLWRYRIGETRTAIGGANSNLGNLLEWIRTALGVDDPLRFGSDDPPAFDGLLASPHLFGERGPGYGPDATAALLGLRPHHTARDIAAAFVLATLATTRELALKVYEVAPDIDALIASGGVVSGAPGFAQLLADAVGRPVQVTELTEASLRGAGRAALDLMPARARTSQVIPPRPRWTAAIERRLAEAQAQSRLGTPAVLRGS